MYNKTELQLFDKNKISQSKKRKKITVTFDEEKRREFLRGFRKRRLERRKKAQEGLEQHLKQQRKKIKQYIQECYKELISFRNIPELKELSQQEYNLKNHTVSVLELNITDFLAKRSKFIYQNEVIEEQDEKHDHSSHDNGEIIGMSLQNKQKALIQKTKSTTKKMSLKDMKQELKETILMHVGSSKAF